MTNISKDNREELLTRLENIKQTHLDDEELIKTINMVENELASKKYTFRIMIRRFFSKKQLES